MRPVGVAGNSQGLLLTIAREEHSPAERVRNSGSFSQGGTKKKATVPWQSARCDLWCASPTLCCAVLCFAALFCTVHCAVLCCRHTVHSATRTVRAHPKHWARSSLQTRSTFLARPKDAPKPVAQILSCHILAAFCLLARKQPKHSQRREHKQKRAQVAASSRWSNLECKLSALFRETQRQREA